MENRCLFCLSETVLIVRYIYPLRFITKSGRPSRHLRGKYEERETNEIEKPVRTHNFMYICIRLGCPTRLDPDLLKPEWKIVPSNMVELNKSTEEKVVTNTIQNESP